MFAAAATPPVVAYLMTTLGWQQALFCRRFRPSSSSCVGLVRAQFTARAPVVTPWRSPSSARIATAAAGKDDWRRLRHLLANRSILLLAFSYVCMNYVFYLIANWCFPLPRAGAPFQFAAE